MARILVVDDDPDFQEMMALVLESAGHEVLSAYDGSQAFRRLALQRPDLVLLDLMMTTETEGMDVARRLRDDPATAPIPIIMLSSVYTDCRQQNKPGPDLSGLSVDRFLDKPVKPGVLLAAVNEQLQRVNR